MKIKLVLIYILTATILFFTGCGDTATTVNTDNTDEIVAKAEAASYEVAPSEEVLISAENSTIGENPVTYTWINNLGQRLGTESTLLWTAPSEEGNYSIILVLNFDQDNESTDTLRIAVKKMTEFPTITLQNDQINVDAFDMNSFHFSGGTINTGQMDAYLGVDLIHNELKFLRFPYHEGVLFLGKYNANTGSLTLNDTLSLPQTGIKEFTKKLYSGEPVKIAIMGDSLLTVSSDPDVREYTWTHLLFDSNRTDLGFNLPNLDNITVHNYSIAAQTAEHGLGMLTKNIVTADGTLEKRTQDAIDENYDLYIIGWGANGNTVDDVSGFNKMAYMENIMNILKEKNVLIINQSPYRFLKDHLEEDVPMLHDIAINFACSYADTWSYTWEESILRDNDIWADDGIHWDFKGQELYAKAIRSAILASESLSEKVPTNNFQYSDFAVQNIEPFFAITPYETNASIASIDSTFGYYTNLSLRLGVQNLLKIETGQYAKFHIPAHVGLLGGLIDSVENNSVEINITVDGRRSTLTLANQANGRESLNKFSESYSLQPATILTIEVLRGTLYLQGILGYKKP